MNLYTLTIHQARELLRRREVSARQVTEAVLDRIAAVEGQLHAYITVTAEEALRQADEADRGWRRLPQGEATPLLGIPLALKDVLCTEGVRTTCGSRILEPFVPPYDATVVRRLRQAGAIVVGKTNMDEFAMGSSTETSHFGPTRNPWDLEAIPGGSSGGSAAAVAADACLAALGSDTGGSIRQPAACCGIVGLKPTYGRVSRFGLVAYASSLDQIGPMTKDVTDCAILLQAIAGHDPRDSTSVNLPLPDYGEALRSEVRGIRIGLPREYYAEGLDPEVREKVEAAVHLLQGLGGEVEEVSLPHTAYAIATYYILATAEASSNLARYDGVRFGYRAEKAAELLEMYQCSRQEGFGPEVKRRIMLGTYALSAGYYEAYYRKAQQVRTLLRGDFDRALERCHVLITPTAPTPAFRLGEKLHDPLQMYLSDIYTISANLAGIPALSLPCGFSRGGLPIGLQIMGRPFGEERLLQVAYTFEQATDHHRRRPDLPGLSGPAGEGKA